MAFQKNPLQARKLKLYSSLKERPGFESYLNLPNKKLRQAITKLRISAHKFPIETGRFDYRKGTERICPLCCDGIGDEMHYLTQCQNSIISRTRVELLEPFHKKWKGIYKPTQIELTNAILTCQNDDMLSETGLLCLKILETFEKEALQPHFCIIQKLVLSLLFLLFIRFIGYLSRIIVIRNGMIFPFLMTMLGFDIVFFYYFSYILAFIFCDNFVK